MMKSKSRKCHFPGSGSGILRICSAWRMGGRCDTG